MAPPAAPGPTATMTGCNIAEPTGPAAKAVRWPPVHGGRGLRSYQSDTNVRGAPAISVPAGPRCLCLHVQEARQWPAVGRLRSHQAPAPPAVDTTRSAHADRAWPYFHPARAQLRVLSGTTYDGRSLREWIERMCRLGGSPAMLSEGGRAPTWLLLSHTNGS